MKHSIAVVAGEISADIHTAPVLERLRSSHPEWSFFGTGGEKMKEAGIDLMANTDELAVMGFSSLPAMIPRLMRLKKRILNRIQQEDTRLAILVDYPGFNLNLAKNIKKVSPKTKILYFIAPQLWAWKPGRISYLQKYVDKLAVILPFEKSYFEERGVPTVYVGNPLMEELREYEPLDIQTRLGSRYLALLPGSRKGVIKTHLPKMVEVAYQILAREQGLCPAVGCSPYIPREFYEKFIPSDNAIELIFDSRKLLCKAKFSIICSGTSTLEAAILGAPQLVIYKTSSINYFIAKQLVNLKSVSLVNIIAGKQLVMECLQDDFNTKKLTENTIRYLNNAELLVEMSESYESVIKSLGKHQTSKTLTDLICQMLD